jgi:hypothetical protein
MDALTAEGFVVLGGPLGGAEGALLVIDAENEETIRTRLADDPWNLAYDANRAAVPEQFSHSVVPKSVEVDLALIEHDDGLLHELELPNSSTQRTRFDAAELKRAAVQRGGLLR